MLGFWVFTILPGIFCMLVQSWLFPFCARMSELIEKETEEYRKGDPDPFDDRHPGKIYILLCLRLFYFVFLLKKGLALLFRQVQNSWFSHHSLMSSRDYRHAPLCPCVFFFLFFFSPLPCFFFLTKENYWALQMTWQIKVPAVAWQAVFCLILELMYR